MSKRNLWRRFWQLLLNPFSQLYQLYTRSRLAAQFSSLRRVMVMLIVWTIILTVVWQTDSFWEFFVAFFMPAFIGIPAAALCQFSSEHNWQLDWKDRQSRRQYLQKTCRGRLFLDRCPPSNLPWYHLCWRWIVWWFRLVFVHAPIRVMVCPFDLAASHDLHHFGDKAIGDAGGEKPEWATWMNAGHYRRWVESECSDQFPLTTYWTLADALDSVFETYQSLDANDPSIDEATVDVTDVATGM